MNERRMTIIALGLSLVMTNVVLFFNFSLALTLQLLSAERVQPQYFLMSWGVTLANGGVLYWLWYIWRRQPRSQVHQMPAKRNELLEVRERHRDQILGLLIYPLSLTEIIQRSELNEADCQLTLDDLIASGSINASWQGEHVIYSLRDSKVHS
jgi:hypothetical protein